MTNDVSSVTRMPTVPEKDPMEDLFRNLPMGIYRTTTDGRILLANPALLAMLGYDRFEEIAKRNLETDGNDASYGRSQFLRRLGNDGYVRGLESFWSRRDGTQIYVRENAVAVRGEAGEILYYEGTVEDISDRHQSEQSIKQSEEQYRLLFDTNPHPMWVYESETFAFLAVNDAAVEHYGYTRSEFLSMRSTDIRPPEEQDRLRRNTARHARSTYQGGPWLHVKKDGTQIFAEIAAYPLTFKGTAARMVTVNDVTAKIRTQKALQESEQRLQTILYNLPVVVFALDQNGVFTFLEGKGLPSLGLKPRQLIGQSVFDIHRDEPEVIRNMRDVLAGGVSSWLYTKEDTTFEMQCRPLYEWEGRPDGLIGVAVDVTERRQLREKILQSEKLATLGEFVAGIAHELNNPLAAISGNAQLLALHPEPQVQEDAQIIRSMADRVSYIVHTLLTFARKSRTDGSERDVYSLRTLWTEALLLFEARLTDAEIAVETPVEEGVEIRVEVDKNQMIQLLASLLSNAQQALRDNSGRVRRIIFRTGTGEGMGWLSISNTGIGMSEAVRQRIFEPFFTTKDFGEGSGLGLSLCHGIAEAHRGHLSVETKEGEGTTFTLHLPLYEITETGEKNKYV